MNPTSADGLRGMLIRSSDGYFLRVCDETYPEGFKDYELCHSDLSIEINDVDAFLYEYSHASDYDGRLDHAPSTLGYDNA